MFAVVLFWERGLQETTFMSLDGHTTEIHFVLPQKKNQLAIICQLDIGRNSIITSWIQHSRTNPASLKPLFTLNSLAFWCMLSWQLYHFGFSHEVIDRYFIAQGYCSQLLLEEEGSILLLFPGILDFIFRADIQYSINSICSFSDIAGAGKSSL